jgi:hypothetical protein
MGANRITAHATGAPRAPKASHVAPPSIPHGFVVCPPHLMTAAAWQQEIYRLAYERARAQMAIPRHHRMLFCVWN